jgi:hypothetical protein
MTSSFKNKETFLNPGVWFGLTKGNGSFPVFCNISSIETYLVFNDLTVNVTVLPGYKIILYNGGSYNCETSWPYIIDNTNGTEIKFCIMPTYASINDSENYNVYLKNSLSSVRVFFEGKEILEQIRYGTNLS